MNMKSLVAGLIICFSGFAFPQQVLDKIIAVIDNEYILQSELDFQTQLLASQKKLNPEDPELKKQVLTALVEEKLVYAQAHIDSIIVTDDEITRQIEYQLNMFIQQYGSKEKVEQAYGMTMEKIKRELREDVQKNLMIQRLREKKFGGVEASHREVEEFFYKYKDSLGVIPEKVKISHIFMNPRTSDRLKNKYKTLAESLLDSIKNGVDFAALAKKYSDDPGSAAQGGELGFVKKGVFYPEFESAAFSLKEGELSGVVESPVGYHIIQLIERRGESINSRHILIKIKSDDEADLNIIEFLTDIRDSILKKEHTFASMAKKYSDDKESAPFGGELGSFYFGQLDKNLLEIVSKMKEGEISFPKRVNYSADSYGYHIVFLQQKIPQHQPDLEIDYVELKRFADEYKKQNLYTKWIEEIKTKIYWEVKL